MQLDSRAAIFKEHLQTQNYLNLTPTRRDSAEHVVTETAARFRRHDGSASTGELTLLFHSPACTGIHRWYTNLQ